MKSIYLLLFFLLFATSSIAQQLAHRNEKGQVLFFQVISEENNEVALVRGKAKYNDSEYIIPEKVDINGGTYTCVEIGDKAFYERDDLKSITLPKTIRRIGDKAFEDCCFETFVFPDSLREIGETPFWNTIVSRTGLADSLVVLVNHPFTNPAARGSYKLYKATQYNTVFKNDVTGVTKEITDLSNIEKSLFEDDLKSIYMPVLTRVERTDNPEDRYSGISEINKENVNWFSFSDDNIELSIASLIDSFIFSLTNKTSHTIKIVWDDAVFVNVDGNTSKVIHNGTNYDESNNPQIASTIIRNAKLTDTITPVAYLKYSSIIGWSKNADLPQSDLYEGKSISIMLPIQLKDVVNEYILEFTLLYLPLHPERISK